MAASAKNKTKYSVFFVCCELLAWCKVHIRVICKLYVWNLLWGWIWIYLVSHPIVIGDLFTWIHKIWWNIDPFFKRNMKRNNGKKDLHIVWAKNGIRKVKHVVVVCVDVFITPTIHILSNDAVFKSTCSIKCVTIFVFCHEIRQVANLQPKTSTNPN